MRYAARATFNYLKHSTSHFTEFIHLAPVMIWPR